MYASSAPTSSLLLLRLHAFAPLVRSDASDYFNCYWAVYLPVPAPIRLETLSHQALVGVLITCQPVFGQRRFVGGAPCADYANGIDDKPCVAKLPLELYVTHDVLRVGRP